MITNNWSELADQISLFTTQEEADELEAAYQEYAALCSLYEQLILREYDPKRKKILESLFEDMQEENK